MDNQREAFKTLAKRLLAYYQAKDDQPREINTEVIRNYHAERNEVLDKASGLRRPYKDVVIAGELGEMIRARKSAMEQRIAGAPESETAKP